MILNRDPDFTVTVHTENTIKRKRKLGGVLSIISEPDVKKYRVSFFKLRCLHDNTSVPFGYV